MVKLGVLQACPHIHADPLLIHQVERCWPSRTGCPFFLALVFCSCALLWPPIPLGTGHKPGLIGQTRSPPCPSLETLTMLRAFSFAGNVCHAAIPDIGRVRPIYAVVKNRHPDACRVCQNIDIHLTKSYNSKCVAVSHFPENLMASLWNSFQFLEHFCVL